MYELYRNYDSSGALLYIGVSRDAWKRYKGHKSASDWAQYVSTIKIDRFATLEIALMEEKKAIRDEKPIYNKAHNSSIDDKEKQEMFGDYTPIVKNSPQRKRKPGRPKTVTFASDADLEKALGYWRNLPEKDALALIKRDFNISPDRNRMNYLKRKSAK